MTAPSFLQKQSGGARRSRHFGPLRLWMAAQVLRAAQDEETGRGTGARGGPAPSSIAQGQKKGGAAASSTAAKARPVHTPKLKLEAAPHPTDAFLKGGGI